MARKRKNNSDASDLSDNKQSKTDEVVENGLDAAEDPSGVPNSSSTAQILDTTPPKFENPLKTRPSSPENAVNIAVAARALFALDEEHELFEKQGLDEYLKHHIANEKTPLPPGTAFPFIQALENVNDGLRTLDPNEDKIFNIVLMSHNHAHTGVRLMRSIRHHNLNIQRMCLTAGTNPVDYLKAYNIKLYLTSYPEEVEQALEKGFAAAAIFDQKLADPVHDQLRVAFDLDAVLFNSGDAELIYNTQGFHAYIAHEQKHVDTPIQEGPLMEFASAIGEMQKKFSQNTNLFPVSPIRIYIVTARSACVGERALKTLRSWGLDVDELHFLAGASKGPVLEAIKPHIFFDDSGFNIASAQGVGTPAAHVKHGSQGFISNKTEDSTVRTDLNKKMSFFNQT